MGKLLYVLRHSQQHLGEVNAELSRRGIKKVRGVREILREAETAYSVLDVTGDK